MELGPEAESYWEARVVRYVCGRKGDENDRLDNEERPPGELGGDRANENFAKVGRDAGGEFGVTKGLEMENLLAGLSGYRGLTRNVSVCDCFGFYFIGRRLCKVFNMMLIQIGE